MIKTTDAVAFLPAPLSLHMSILMTKPVQKSLITI